MICNTNNPAIRRYTFRLLAAMAFYLVFLVAAVYIFSRHHPTGWPAYLLAAAPGLPIVGVLAVIGIYLAEEKDEFLRNMSIQSMIWAIGGTLALTTIWGFLELFVKVPHLELYLIFPIFWAFVGVATCGLKWRYR